jgi:hypothetical protein
MTTTNKGLIQPANGSYVDTWDQPVNNDWSYIDTAFGGAVSLNATGISTHTLTLTEYRPLFLSISGAISNNVTYSIPSGVGGQWVIFNGTTDATGGPWSIIFTCVGSAVTVTIPRGTTTNVACDGTNLLFADGRPGSPGGSNTQVQYNNNGTLGGSSNFVFDGINVGIGTSSVIGGSRLNISGGGISIPSGNGVFYNPGGSDATGTNLFATGQVFYCNGSERMRIDSIGNLLIGTTNAYGKLFVSQTNNNTCAFFSLESGAGAGNVAAKVNTNLTTQKNMTLEYLGVVKGTFKTDLGAVYFDGTQGTTIFQTAGAEAMRIGPAGDVAIGGTLNTGTYKWLTVTGPTTSGGGILQVQNSDASVTANFFCNNLAAYVGTGTNMPFLVRVNSNEVARFDTSGNVGIGTTSTSGTRLNTSVSTAANAITATLATGAHDCSAYIATTASGVYNFDFFGAYTASGVQYRVDGAGNVFTYGGTINTAGGSINTAGGSITSGAITSSGLVHSTSGGFQFPDSTIQTTAATGYTPPTSFSAVGTYAFLYYNGGIVGSGSTVTSNGANLFPCDTNIANVSAIGAGQVWQCMGYMGGTAATLWLRTS